MNGSAKCMRTFGRMSVRNSTGSSQSNSVTRGGGRPGSMRTRRRTCAESSWKGHGRSGRTTLHPRERPLPPAAGSVHGSGLLSLMATSSVDHAHRPKGRPFPAFNLRVKEGVAEDGVVKNVHTACHEHLPIAQKLVLLHVDDNSVTRVCWRTPRWSC